MIKQFIKKRIGIVQNFENKEGGFTLVEALTAIFILTFVVVGLMTVVSDSLFATKYAKDEITANYLLQEVVDFVRNDRDTAVFLNIGEGINSSWSDFVEEYTRVEAGCSSSSGCIVDVNLSDNNLRLCSSPACSYLYLHEGDNVADLKSFYVTKDYPFGITGRVKTNFQRTLKVTEEGANQLKVEVTVNWKNGNLSKSRSLSTTLSKWQ